MAKKVYYRYNPKTLKYEETKAPHEGRFRRLLVALLFGVVLGIASAIFFNLNSLQMFDIESNPKVESLFTQYRLMSNKVDDALAVLEELQQRDDNLYRVMLQSEPVSKSIRNMDVSNNAYYEELLQLPQGEVVASTAKKVELLSRQIYVQAKSFEELIELGRTHEDRLKCIPAIQPVSNKDLKRMASGYGYRIDPIYKTRKFHEGMDFSAPIGTPVFATGDGTVIKTGWESGYGYTVVIDHGHGYQTRYAHLSKILTTRGRKVERGDNIAEVGNTGKSSGPHLHYEVIYNGHHVNPVNYYFFDLSPEEYDKMVRMTDTQGVVMD